VASSRRSPPTSTTSAGRPSRTRQSSRSAPAATCASSAHRPHSWSRRQRCLHPL